MADSNQHPGSDLDGSQPSLTTLSLWSSPSSSSPLRFLGSVSRTIFPSAPRRRHRTSRPLPVLSASLAPLRLRPTSSIAYELVDDVAVDIFSSLENVEKHLQYWHNKAEESAFRKARFMVLQRGPRAFVGGLRLLIDDHFSQGTTGIPRLSELALRHIKERINALTDLRDSLATFLAQLCVWVNKFGELNQNEPDKSMAPLLASINGAFLYFEKSVRDGRFSAARLIGSSVDGSYSSPLLFERLPPVPDINRDQWTDCEIRDAINLIYLNLDKMDVYLAPLVDKHKKPRTITRQWLLYAFGAVGISVFSLWLLSHSRVAGSPDLDNWILKAKDIFSNVVGQPLIALRDVLFDTFRKRQRGVKNQEEVQLTSDSLHRMVVAFSEKTKGQKFSADASDQQMFEIVMVRYEHELTHPIRNLLWGELARAMLIQIQKVKLDIETTMIKVNQILSALPAFSLSLLVLTLLRAWVKQYTRAAESRGKAALGQRKLLIKEVQEKMRNLRKCYPSESDHKHIKPRTGLVFGAMFQLYREVERYEIVVGELRWLREDIHRLGKLDVSFAEKMRIISDFVDYLIQSSP